MPTSKRKVSLFGYKVLLPSSSTVAVGGVKRRQEERMPIDLLGTTRIMSLEQELARQAFDIIHQPFTARYLRNVKTVAISRAPVRVDTGGWSDCWWFLDRYPGYVCNLALALYSYVVAIIFDRPGGVTYHALDLDDLSESGLIEDLEGKYVHKAAAHFPGAFDSLETYIVVNTMAPPKAGLGSSGSVGVATVALLAHLAKKVMSRKEIALLAHHIEHYEQERESGIQDQAVAARGPGRIEMTQGAFPEFKWTPLDFPPGMIQMIESSMLLVNTGEGRSSSDEHKKKIEIIQSGGDGAQEALDCIIAMAEAAKTTADCIEAGDWEGVCNAVGVNWKNQVALDPSAETDRIKAITLYARRRGASVKGWGAAGGGVMGILCPKGRQQRDEIAKRLEEVVLPEMEEASILPTKITPNGVEVCSFTGAELRQLVNS